MTPMESLPTFKKSRARRRGDPALCPNPANSNAIVKKWPKLSGLQELDTKPEAQERKAEALADPDFHGICFLYSLGMLPFGICSSSLNPADVQLSVPKIIYIWSYGPFLMYDVSHGLLGMFVKHFFSFLFFFFFF